MTSRNLAYYVEGVAEGRRGILWQRQKDRSVWKVEEAGRVWFAKRGLTPKRRREIRREVENARALHAAALGPEVLAAGAYASAEWIVTTDAGCSCHTLLMELWTADVARKGLLANVASLVRTLHERGWTFPDLTEEHIRFGPDGRLVLIDAARLARGESPASLADRARDMAALLFSLGPAAVEDFVLTRSERVRLLREASGSMGRELRRLSRRVDARISELSTRTRWRHGYGTSTDAFDDAQPADTDLGPTTFDRLMGPAGMTVVRTLPDRENRTLGRGADGKPLFFVKVFPATKKGWSPAMRELAAIDLFQRAGILVNRVAAYAEDVDKGSMVAVKAARGEPLDDLLRRGVSVAERRALAVQTARIWRRMRECGLRHRDAYPCHVFAAGFVVPASAGPSVASRKTNDPAEAGTTNLRHELRLIDLTRGGRAPFPKERWFVKDAAALWHGLPKPPVTRTDAVRWLREYFRIDRLDARAKRFARRVASKEARIAARQARKRRA